MWHFYCESVSFKMPPRTELKKWLSLVASFHTKDRLSINYIFCSDPFLLEINKKYLNHSYFTDIITFDYSIAGIIKGDIFISIDTVLDNAGRFNVSFYEELHRVMAHGLLHLIGFNDKTKSEAAIMKMEEDRALLMLKNM